MIMYYNYEEKEDPVDVVIVQPNTDPYNEQYLTPPPIITNRILSPMNNIPPVRSCFQAINAVISTRTEGIRCMKKPPNLVQKLCSPSKASNANMLRNRINSTTKALGNQCTSM